MSLLLILLSINFLDAFVLINNNVAFTWYPICYGLDNETASIFECCKAAAMTISHEDRHNCTLECLPTGGKACCYDNCFAERRQIFKEKIFYAEKFIDALAEGKENERVIRELAATALDYCGNQLRYEMQSIQSQTCDMPDTVYMLTKCVILNVFLKCPNYVKSERCDELMRIMSNCVEKTTTLQPQRENKK